MAKTFSNKTSYSLLKTNPKLTGNIKLVVDSKGDIFIETIDASPELTRNKYKKIKLDTENDWSSAVYNLFTSGTIPESILYGLKDNEDFLSIKTDYSKQYYTNYQQGATPKISKLYEEQISYFAPLWLEPNDIPEHFAIFKVTEPVSVSTKNETEPFNEDIEKQIYDTNYFETIAAGATGPESDYFFETILSKAKLHKVFDMGPGSVIGSYLSKHINDSKVPESSLTIDWNINKPSTVNGISLRKSGFTNESFNLFSEAFPVDRTITEFDNLITNQFELNGVIHPNIINLEFLFDDESNNEFEVSRYFGVYFNRNDISKFKLDSKAFYDKKYDNLPQNKDIKSIYDVDILSDTNITLQNFDGVKLFVDYENDYKLLSSDIKASNFLPYIYSTDGIFYDINNNVDWGNDEIVLKDTFVNTRDLKGFTKESLGIIPSTKTNKEGRSYFEFQLLGTTNSFELRIRSVDEDDADFNINQVFVGDLAYPKGQFKNNKFSLAGNVEDVTTAIVGAINTYADMDEDFNLYAIAKFDKVIVFTRGTNEYWNNYEFLIFSDDVNFPNVVSVPSSSFMTIPDYNLTVRGATYSGGTGAFKDYNTIISGATSLYLNTNMSILQQNFKGGNDYGENRIRIPKEYESYFNTDLFLATREWYTKVVSVCAYLDEPVYQNGRIVNFDDFDSYLTINCADDVWVSTGAYSELYEIETNRIGMMSMYPTKQFDIDQFRSDYGKDGDGYIDLLESNYAAKGGTSPGATAINVRTSIDNFKDSGFKRLGSVLDETTGDIAKITNEYDRLKENELPQIAIKGRIIPYINKWVYDDEGVDVRENNYRLNSNSAFSYDSFVPSNVNKVPDFRFFTHEWYYLQEYPDYGPSGLSTEQKINSFSYFDSKIEIGATGLANVTDDYFLDYFTQYQVDGKTFPKKTKYSKVSGGNDDSFGETFFRGAKLIFKKRVEIGATAQPLNFNIENIGVYKSDEFNDYKFSAVLTNKTEEAVVYKVIENKQFKNITFVIEADLDDYYLTRNQSGDLFLDRSLLYVLESKFNSNGDYADVPVSGAIVPFLDIPGNPVPQANFTYSTTENLYTINGVQNDLTKSIPNFTSQIIPDDTGKYSDIITTTTTGDKIYIKGIVGVTKNTITAKDFYVQTGGFAIRPMTTSWSVTLPVEAESIESTPRYIKGGYNAFKGVLQDISFASIFDKVNNGSPDIQYITINEDGTETPNTFLLEFEKYSINVKADYIKTEGIIFNGVRNSNFKPIGQKAIGMENTYMNTMYRFNGRYNPKVEDVILFKDVYGATSDSKFTPEIIEQLRFTNTQFFSTYPGFALYKQLYISKINEQNPFTVLDLNKTTALLPEFWKIGEVSLDKQDSYIFRSCWDNNYHKHYESKNKFVRYPGYIEPKEVSSFLASTIMNIPEDIKITKYDASNIIIARGPTAGISSNNKFGFSNIPRGGTGTNVVTGKIVNSRQLISDLTPKLQGLFDKYVNDSYNFRKLDTLDDDISRYITTNILPRYFSRNIYAYVKYSSKLANEPLIENNKTEQELLLSGYVRLENIKFQLEKFSDFDYSFTFSKPTDKNITLAFVTNISVV